MIFLFYSTLSVTWQVMPHYSIVFSKNTGLGCTNLASWPCGWWPAVWSKDPVSSAFCDIRKYLVVYILCFVSEIVSAIFWIRKHWRRQEKTGALWIWSPRLENMFERCGFIYSLYPSFYFTSHRLFLVLGDWASMSSSTGCFPASPGSLLHRLLCARTPCTRTHPSGTHPPDLAVVCLQLSLLW